MPTAADKENIQYKLLGRVGNVMQLKKVDTACIAVKVAGYTCSEVRAGGYSCADIKQAGFTAADAKAAGYTWDELGAAGFTLSERRDASFTTTQIGDALAKRKAGGRSCVEAFQMGYTCAEATAAGYGLSAIGKVYTVKDMRAAGYSCKQVIGTKQAERDPTAKCLAAGYSFKEAKHAGYRYDTQDWASGMKGFPL